MSVRWPELVWYGDSSRARTVRGALAPFGWLYAGVSSMRNRLYDLRLLPAVDPPLPTLSVGNLSVGGTGKTPVAAWAASRLLAAGARPAIVLRGYGGDEPLVHERLNPHVIVVIGADRVRAVEHARDAGADCVILDDAFQHRRLRRNEDWVLVATEQWRSTRRCLPAGPLREPVSALSRATLIAVTRKSASAAQADEVASQLAGIAPGLPVAIFHLAPTELVNALDDSRAPLIRLRGARVLAVAAIGAPEAFYAQLRHEGAVVSEAPFGDHHAFSAAQADGLARRAAAYDMAVCTLKDAVKLAPLWPRKGSSLWYVSQRAAVERGDVELDASLTKILAARASVPPTAGPAGLDSSAHGYRSSTADQ